MMRTLQRAWQYWGRLGVATWLLAALAGLTVLGSLFPQLPADPSTHPLWLTAAEDKYGPLARLMAGVKLFAFFRSAWFWVPAGGLALSLLICTLRRFLPIWRGATGHGHPPTLEALAGYPCRAQLPIASRPVARAALRAAFRAEARAGEQAVLVGERNRAARLGTLAVHIAPLLLLIGAAISGLTAWRESVTVSTTGDPVPVGPAGAFSIRLNDWQVDHYPDGSPADYRAELTILQDGRPVQTSSVRVNHSLSYRGVSLTLMGYTQSPDGAQVKLLAGRDIGYPLVIGSGLLLVIGVCLSIYFPHQQVWAWVTKDGITLELAGRTSGGTVAFGRSFEKLVQVAQSHLGTDGVTDS